MTATECPPGCGCGFCLIDRQGPPSCTDCGVTKPAHDPLCRQYVTPREHERIAVLDRTIDRLVARVRELEEALATCDRIAARWSDAKFSPHVHPGLPPWTAIRDAVAAALSPAAEGE
jgi:hypothetical protein